MRNENVSYQSIIYTKFKIDQTYSFNELSRSNNGKIVHAPSKGKISTKAGENLQEGESPSQTSPVNHKSSTLALGELINMIEI